MIASSLLYTYIDSPVGPLILAGLEDGLQFVSFSSGSRVIAPKPAWRQTSAAFETARQQLEAYFAGERQSFAVPLRPTGTAFQLRVWAALIEIPYGTTTTYGTLASKLGMPAASRAVGAANGANPLPILVPCHRVIGANGALTGFGGGIAVKKALLALEKTRDEANAYQPSLF